MEEDGGLAVIDAILTPAVRDDLEDRFWRPIEAQATLEVLRDDPDFLASPGTHPAMFADHGVVHVRDVAIGLVRLLETIDGVLLPRRPGPRRRFVEAYGVAAAYLHDVGMVDLTPVGRRTHPQFAAHAAFGPDVTPLVDRLLGPGPVRDRLDEVAARAPFATPLEVVVREMLSLTLAHSKSAVPAAVLNDRVAFRRLAQRVVFTDLGAIRGAARLPTATDADPIPFDANTAAYADPTQAFAWLCRDRRPAGRLRRRRDRRAAGVAGGGRAAAAGDGAPDVRRVRAVHRRRDGQGRVHAAARERRRGLRHQLRRPPVCRRGEHQGGVRDAAGTPAHRVPPRRVR